MKVWGMGQKLSKLITKLSKLSKLISKGDNEQQRLHQNPISISFLNSLSWIALESSQSKAYFADPSRPTGEAEAYVKNDSKTDAPTECQHAPHSTAASSEDFVSSVSQWQCKSTEFNIAANT